MNKPDCSIYVAHFTNGGKLKGDDNSEGIKAIEGIDAYHRLIQILEQKVIKASKMPWTGAQAVCFTESPWTSLLSHTQRYSPYGIGFKKSKLFTKHGGPALYMRTDLYRKQLRENNGFSQSVMPFITPFSPLYRPWSMKKTQYDIGDCDYSHEREWRVPHDFTFEYEDISFVVLDCYQDLAHISKELKDAIGGEKFLFMENYKFIEELWPVHIK